MRSNKKGMEMAVAWVLLLGFSVTLAVVVSMWAVDHARKSTESTIKFVEGEQVCEQVQIYAVFTPYSPGGDQVDDTKKCTNITIVNNGYFTVNELVLRGINKITKQSIPNKIITDTAFVPLKPKEQKIGETTLWNGVPQNVPANTEGATVELIPVLKDEKGKTACSDRLVRIEC